MNEFLEICVNESIDAMEEPSTEVYTLGDIV